MVQKSGIHQLRLSIGWLALGFLNHQQYFRFRDKVLHHLRWLLYHIPVLEVAGSMLGMDMEALQMNCYLPRIHS